MKFQSLRTISSVALVALLITAAGVFSTAPAQNTYGTIVGVVTDETGAVIPGASVTAMNVDTNIVTSAETNQSGDYRILNLLPGNYDLTVETTGFKKSVTAGVTIQVNQSVRIEIAMQVGDVVETVEVSAAAVAQLETTRATLGTVVSNAKVVELPLNGRDFTQLTLLLPGASPGAGAGGFFLIGGQTVAVTGNRSDQNNYTLDGVNNNETFFKHYGIRPSLDAIQEFNVQTNITSAEYGEAAGANINVAIKSGTNQIHGAVFEFLRNDNFDTKTFFATEKSEFRWNQFGATVGGPLIKNRTFWFAHWESFRFRRESTILSTVPTQDMRGGVFTTNVDGTPLGQIFDIETTVEGANGFMRNPFPNNTIPASRFHSTSKTWQEGVFGPFLPNLPAKRTTSSIRRPTSATTTRSTYGSTTA